MMLAEHLPRCVASRSGEADCVAGSCKCLRDEQQSARDDLGFVGRLDREDHVRLPSEQAIHAGVGQQIDADEPMPVAELGQHRRHHVRDSWRWKAKASSSMRSA